MAMTISKPADTPKASVTEDVSVDINVHDVSRPTIESFSLVSPWKIPSYGS